MMRFKTFSLCFATICFCITLFAQSAQSLFIEGNILFAKEEFTEAKETYLRAIEIDESSNLHYNLANTYWKLDQTPQAIIHYLKALLLDPTNTSARGNLNYLLRLNQLPNDQIPSENLLFLFNETQWTWIVAVSFWILIVAYFLKKLSISRRTPLRLLALVFLLISGVAIFALYQFHQYKSIGMNLNKEIVLKVAPTNQSPTQVTTRNWEFLKIITRKNNFLYVELRDGTRGYVLDDEIINVAD